MWLDLPLWKQTRNRGCKTREQNAKVLFKELPYFDLTGRLPLYHGQFHNSFQSELPTNRSLESFSGFYDLNLFKLDTNLDARLDTDNNLFNHKIYSRYFSPHNFKKYSNSLTKKQLESSFSIFHNNINKFKWKSWKTCDSLFRESRFPLRYYWDYWDENCQHKSKFCWPLEVLGSSWTKTLITQCLKRSHMKPFRHCGSRFLLANRRMSYVASFITNTILQIVLLNILVIQSKS